jgi:hypothetical protein
MRRASRFDFSSEGKRSLGTPVFRIGCVSLQRAFVWAMEARRRRQATAHDAMLGMACRAVRSHREGTALKPDCERQAIAGDWKGRYPICVGCRPGNCCGARRRAPSAALDHIRGQGLTVIPIGTCAPSFVRGHPEHRDVVREDMRRML